jgi:AraC family transcriptional regulator
VKHEPVLAMALRRGSVEMGLHRSAMKRHTYDAGEMSLIPGHLEKWFRNENLRSLLIGISDAALAAASDGASGEVELRRTDNMVDARLGALVEVVNTERIAGFPSGRLFLDSVEQALAVTLVNGYALRHRSVRTHRGGLGSARLRRIKEFAPYSKHPGTVSTRLPGILPCRTGVYEDRSHSLRFKPAVSRRDRKRIGSPPVSSLHEQLGIQDVALRQLVTILATEVDDGGPGGKLYEDSLAHALATRLIYLGRAEQKPEPPKVSALPRHLLQRVIDRMRVDFKANLNFAALAAESGYSRAHFLRIFRIATGQTPHRYLLDLRLEHARRLVKDRYSRLIEIAADCGFSSHAYFTTVFTRRFGETPSMYSRES